jgi:3-deoxy-D-manno-octulosonic acid (KDO) 8-phosphate synthase
VPQPAAKAFANASTYSGKFQFPTFHCTQTDKLLANSAKTTEFFHIFEHQFVALLKILKFSLFDWIGMFKLKKI